MANIKKFDEYVNENIVSEEFDLQKEFDYLNNLMFDNKISPIKLKWFNSKTKLGLLTHTNNIVDKLEISNFYKLSKKQFMETLAHEMIHAYMVQNNIFEKDPHGNKFQSFVNDLNSRFPQYNIKKTENAYEFSVNSKNSKTIGVLLFKDDLGMSAIFVTLEVFNNVEMIDKFIDDLKNYIKRVPLNIFYKNKTVDIEFYKCSHPDLSSFKIKRSLSLSNLQFFSVYQKTLDIIQEGEFIKTINIK